MKARFLDDTTIQLLPESDSDRALLNKWENFNRKTHHIVQSGSGSAGYRLSHICICLTKKLSVRQKLKSWCYWQIKNPVRNRIRAIVNCRIKFYDKRYRD